MIEEAPVLGRENRLDDIVGHLAQLHAVIVADAALAERRAVTVEEGYGDVRPLHPVVGRLPEGGNGERKRQDRAGDPERQPVTRELDADAAPARDVEPVGERVDLLIGRANRLCAGIDRVVEPGIDAERTFLETSPEVGLRRSGGRSI
jgi:hypothetical protein